jgi:hypothetical protein
MKKRNIIIAILISLTLMVGAFLGTFFTLKPKTIEAQEYNYGDLNPAGYYELDGVVFYAVKVKEVNGTQTYANVTGNSFTLGGITYTINDPTTPASLSYTIGTQPLTINIREQQFFTINGINYAFDFKTDPTKVLRVVEVGSIEESKFTLGGVEYTINSLAPPTTLTYTGGEVPVTVGSDFSISFNINGVDYIFDEVSTPTKVYRVLYNYWPTYEVVMKNNKPDFVKFGETVLLKPDESILISFARQTESSQGDNAYIIKEGEKLSTSVDLLTGFIEINGIDKTNDNINTTVGGIQKQEFGYIFNLNNETVTGKNQNSLLGIADGTEGSTNNEGLVEFTANYEIGSSRLNEFSFMFYMFKEETYQRNEEINTNPTQHFFRPNPALNLNGSLLEHVTDSATKNQFFSEAFYYYDDNRYLPYLEYDYTRYEIDITKTIHNNTITYNLTYGIIDAQTNEKGVIVAKRQDLSTMDVYARDLRIEKIEGTTKVKIYFEDLGVYDFLYKAVYYKTNGEKVVLETLNTDNRKDRMTIYGTQATYQDINKGRSSFRSEDNTISADVTGKGFSTTFSGGSVTTIGFEEEMIASTNQPQVSLLFNSTVVTAGENEFKVYYSSTLNGNFLEDTSYTYTSNFTTPGYYYIIVTNQYSQYKIWLGNSTQYSSSTPKTQVYFFQIKDQTPDLGIYQLKDNGEVPNIETATRVYSGSYYNGAYIGSYTKNGVQIYEAKATSIFDSPVVLSVQFREFNQTTLTTINLPSESASELTAQQISYLNSFGITKYDGYYTFTRNGHYSVKLNFGKSGSTSCLFDIDTEAISGIKVYNTDIRPEGSLYYNATLLAQQGTFATTKEAIALLWNQKASGAKITAKYVRFDLVDNNYKNTKGYEADDDNIYKINDTWLAADYAIVLSETNPETIYNSAPNAASITASSVLTLDGLYIFKLQDEAGNVAFYSVLVDTSIPTVLQSGNGIVYKKITGINNVSEETEVFFGSHKAIAFMFKGELANPISEEEGSLTHALTLLGNKTFAEYYNALFENLATMGATNSIRQDNQSNYFVTVPIRKVTFEIVDGDITDLPQSNINQGYHILIPIRNDVIPGQEIGRIADKTYVYQIYDASNKSERTPTRAYSIRVNTDQTGLTVYYKKGNKEVSLSHNSSSTSADLMTIINYYKPVGNNVTQLYLTWSNLHHEETMGAYVDLLNNGLVCYFYELVWDEAKHSFKYSNTGTQIALDFSDITEIKEKNGQGVEISINLNLGMTAPGMYQIIRKYSYTESGSPFDLGNDYDTVVTTFFVDRTNIITAPTGNGSQNGYYTFMTLFDGGAQTNKIFYNSLYQQSQTSDNYVIQTNELPIGFYIPVSKYGTFYKVESGVSTTNITKNDIQSGNFAYRYENLVEFGDLDVSQSAGVTNTVYSPYALKVVLQSPSAVRNPKTGLYYHYTYDSNGYFMLAGYSIGEGNMIPIIDRKAFIAKNPVTNATEWETGTYKLTIGAIKQDDNSYLQNFYFRFNVIGKTPSYDLDAEYPELENMDAKKLVEGDLNYYYTNANQILVKWEESTNNFLTKIDITRIQYSYTIGSTTTTKYAGTDFSVISTGNSRSFRINVPNNATRVVVTMIYETYSTDTGNYYRKYYQGGLYQSVRTIIIDRQAPVQSITDLINNDDTVKGVNSSLLRTSTDTRFNKTITTGIYKYYSFMPKATFITDLVNSLKTNSSYETKYFYYRHFPDKYVTSIIYETGLGLDPTAQANNVFNEYYALNNNWKKADKDTIVDEDYINNNFSSEGYYEFIEFDLAGNMTIYTVYLTSGNILNLDFNQKLSVAQTSGSLNFEKIPEGFKVTLKQLESPEIKTNPAETSINSFDTFNFKNLDFGVYSYIYNTVSYSNSYKYMKIVIDDIDYIVTPFGYENINTGSEIKSSCTKVYRRSDGAMVELENIKLNSRGTAHTVLLNDTVNKKTHTLLIKVTNSNARITDNGGVNIVSDSQNLSMLIGGPSFNKTIAIVIREQANAALKFAPSSLMIFEINELFANKYELYELSTNILTKTTTSAGYITTYYYIPYNSNSFDTSTFYFAFKDDFGNEYFDYVEYKAVNFDRYEYTGNDLTRDMQTNDEILVSRDIMVNFSNLFTTNITAKINDNTNYIDATGYYDKMGTPEGAYKQFHLKALDTFANGYYGGLIKFKIDLKSNIPEGIIDDLTGGSNNYTTISSANNIIKTIYVSIFNELPQILITTNEGRDITDSLLNEEITQSEPITISFNSASDLAESLGITSKVFIRLRGDSTDYYEIKAPKTISEPGIYDIYIQNFKADGTLDFVQAYDFVISNLDVIFYTVVKTNNEGNQEIISPTGKVFKYLSGGTTIYVPYHYIVNTDSYEIKTNGEKVRASEPYFDSATNTYVYRISSTASSGVVFNTTIAITIIPATNNILGSNSFTWYYGTTYTSPSPESYIRSTVKDIFLTQEDGYDEITLRWDSFYSSPYNKITCYVSSDDGQTWSVVNGVSDGDFTTLTLTKSSNYLFKFVDYAGNTQTFNSVSGYPSITTRVTFIRSVIYKLNDKNPLDNSIYNETVTISLPANMASYYSSVPTLVVMKNNKEYQAVKNKDGNYEFTEAGTYVIYFSVKVKNGTRNLNEDKLTFTIINENDSRWAFNYVNYNNYVINYIRYNGVTISSALRAYAIPNNGNEINISAFLEDSLGNKYFNNGVYTIKMTSIDDAMGSQSFEFNFWLNDATPPITVSLAEGATTTGAIKVSFNEANLYETIGDCYVMINNTIISEIDSSSTDVQEISLTNVRSYYIQVYTNSGKLAYSYRVEITEPLNTVTIILIVVSSVVVAGGALLFFLLRKRMKIR